MKILIVLSLLGLIGFAVSACESVKENPSVPPSMTASGQLSLPVPVQSKFLLSTEHCKVVSLGPFKDDWIISERIFYSVGLRMKNQWEFFILPMNYNEWGVVPTTGNLKNFTGDRDFPRPSWKVDFETGQVQVLDIQDFLDSDWSPRAMIAHGSARGEAEKFSTSGTGGGIYVTDRAPSGKGGRSRKVQTPPVKFTLDFYTQGLTCLFVTEPSYHGVMLRFVDHESASLSDVVVSIPFSLVQGMSFSSGYAFSIRPEGFLVIYLRTAAVLVDINKVRSAIDLSTTNKISSSSFK